MANLYVTFMQAFPYTATGQGQTQNVARGEGARTETISIPALASGQTVSTLAATGSSSVVRVRAKGACWVAIGSNPTTIAVDGIRPAHYFEDGDLDDFYVTVGHKVAVVGAT